MPQTSVWRLYAHDGCLRCNEAAGALLDLLRGLKATIRIKALARAGSGPHQRDIPRLESPNGDLVWQGALDEAATRRAWREASRGVRPSRPAGQAAADHETR